MSIETRLEVLENELKLSKRINRFLLIVLLIFVGYLPISLTPVKADESIVSQLSDLEERVDSLESKVSNLDVSDIEGLEDRLNELESKVGS